MIAVAVVDGFVDFSIEVALDVFLTDVLSQQIFALITLNHKFF